VKPFLLLGIRADDTLADDEYAAMLRHSGLAERDLRRHRLERDELGHVDLDDWSGIILGGGPFEVSNPEDEKSDVQRRVEAEVAGLLDRVVPADFPFLGACYGIGTLGRHQGALVDRTYGEPVGGVTCTLTKAGKADPVFGIVHSEFGAYVGHKEAIHTLPDHAVVLASSPTCPVQAFRVGSNVYATQFHPELDQPGLRVRVEAYRHDDYFSPDQVEEILANAYASGIVKSPRFLAAFADRHARS
jgi:GMP synthase (glutamine-hydrolysing)